MEAYPIDKLRLRFHDGLEQEFRDDYYTKSLGQMRFGIFLGAVLYALFGLLDLKIFPEVRYQAWFVRYVVVIPACAALLLFSHSSRFKNYMQIAVLTVVLVSGAGIIALMVIVRSPVNYFHFAGLLLIIMYTYTFSKMRFLYTLLASWALVAMYNISAFWIFPHPLSVILNDNFFYISANLIGMSSSYHRELYMRRDFYQNRIVRELEAQKHLDEKEKLHEAVDKAILSFRESEARFRTLAETTTASIVIHRGGRFLYTNPHVQKTTGYTKDELLNMNFWEIIHLDFQDFVRQRGKGRLSGQKEPEEYELKVVAKNGETRWVNTMAGIIDYEGHPAIIATLFDITARKQAEEEKVKLYEERIAEEKRHVMEKEKLLMDLHDGVGGITTNINILSELAQKETGIDSIKGTLATISALSREGISEIRSFMQSLDTREMNWRTLAAELRSRGTNMLEPHNIAFSLETRTDDVPEQPGSLLWVNLFKIYKEALTNVIKHSKARTVTASLHVVADGLFLSIQDDGIGWESKPGGGRGLSNMKKRAEEIGGQLSLSSGNGSRVNIVIPIPLKYPLAGMES